MQELAHVALSACDVTGTEELEQSAHIALDQWVGTKGAARSAKGSRVDVAERTELEQSVHSASGPLVELYA